MLAAPDGPGSGPVLDLEKELQLILASVEDTRRHAGAYVRILNEGNLESITQALEEERFHVLHVSCHAGPGVLLLEAADGSIDAVTPGRLAAAIPHGRGVPLVVLSGCSTALDIQAERSSRRQAGLADQTELSGLARGLSAAGVPAVLAMTATVTDRYATALASVLYRQLALREAPKPSQRFRRHAACSKSNAGIPAMPSARSGPRRCSFCAARHCRSITCPRGWNRRASAIRGAP